MKKLLLIAAIVLGMSSCATLRYEQKLKKAYMAMPDEDLEMIRSLYPKLRQRGIAIHYLALQDSVELPTLSPARRTTTVIKFKLKTKTRWVK